MSTAFFNFFKKFFNFFLKLLSRTRISRVSHVRIAQGVPQSQQQNFNFYKEIFPPQDVGFADFVHPNFSTLNC